MSGRIPDGKPTRRSKSRVASALAVAAAGALTLSLVAESAAQRGGFGGFGGRQIGGAGIGRPGNVGRFPGNDGPRYPGGTGPRGPGGIIMLPPGGYGPGPGPRTVVVVDDDDWPQRRRKPKQAKHKQIQKQQKQIAQRGGFDAPPPGETRFVPNEVLLNVAGDLSTPALDAIARRHRLTRLELRDFATTRRRIVRLRINDGRTVATVIRSLQVEARVLGAQPNHLYLLEQAKDPGGPPQYAIGKLRLSEAHALAKGESVRVAVIDTTIDGDHPDLAGAIAASFNATGAPDKPHHHGTGIAGVIAARGKLTGAAPAVRILAVNAFSSQRSNGSSMNILKGLDWAGIANADVVNMSFAGPADAELHTMLAALRRQGVVLIAAAGNAGPNSRPLYPAAEPDVIAVTATDADDKLFAQANRGTHIAVAAPGVAILAVAPNAGYQLQTGTSFAAAQVSGVAALLLERNRKLDPGAIRRILASTARDLGPAGHDDQFGSGLVDAFNAVESAVPKASDVSGSVVAPPAN
jgi:subtilisin family serine protease